MIDYVDSRLSHIRFLVYTSLMVIVQINVSYAQTFELVPNDSIMASVWLEDNVALTIEQKNITQDTLHLVWARVDELVPARWEVSVCDNVFCYTSLVDSGAMSPVGPGDRGKLYIRFTPHVNAGKAVVRYAVWDTKQPETKDTLTYILTAQSTTSVGTNSDNNFMIVHDRQSSTIQISTLLPDTFSAFLYNLLGELVATSYNCKFDAVLPMHQALNGFYMLCVESARSRQLFHLHKN